MKKSQITGTVIKYALIALVIILIQFIGYKAFTTIREKQCQVELTKFEIDLKGIDKTLSYGTVEEKDYDVPCGVDEIYLIDLDKEISPDMFDNLIIKDSLKDKVQKNVFLVKDNKVKKAFYAGNLEFLYPYHACLKPYSDKMNIFLEGAGKKGVKITPGCTQAECTLIPIDVNDEEIIRILSEFIDECEDCPLPEEVESEIEKFWETLKKVNLYRRIRYCKDTGITTVEIIIKPKKGVKAINFRFFEVIPKECIEILGYYLAETIEGAAFIKGDPLIVWQFDTIDKETMISYKLGKDLSDKCRKAIEGLGIAERIEEEGELGPLSLDLPDEIILREDELEHISTKLTHFTDGYEDPDTLSYRILNPLPGIVDCKIDDKKLHCEREKNDEGEFDIIIRVSDGTSIAEDAITVTVEPYVEATVRESESSESDESSVPEDESEVLIKFQCEENKYAHCQANCQPGDCALDFGEGWEDIDCGCCGVKTPLGCAGDVKPLCKKTWWTECGIDINCGTGHKVDEQEC